MSIQPVSRGGRAAPRTWGGARRFGPQHLAGLRAVAGLPELRRRILIYRGDRPLRTKGGIDVWPVATFLDALAAGTLWP